MKTEFTVDPDALREAARRRLLLRAGVAVGLVAAFGLAVGLWLPQEYRTLAFSFALTLSAVYAAVEISALQWSKRGAPAMRVRLGKTELECWIGAIRYPLPYAELSITRIVQRRGLIKRIDLKGKGGARLQLAGFDDMETLAKALAASLVAVRADKA
jgi:hypothetical protein